MILLVVIFVIIAGAVAALVTNRYTEAQNEIQRILTENDSKGSDNMQEPRTLNLQNRIKALEREKADYQADPFYPSKQFAVMVGNEGADYSDFNIKAFGSDLLAAQKYADESVRYHDNQVALLIGVLERYDHTAVAGTPEPYYINIGGNR